MEQDIISNINIPVQEKQKAISGMKKDFPDGIPRCGTDALRFGLLTFDIKCKFQLKLYCIDAIYQLESCSLEAMD